MPLINFIFPGTYYAVASNDPSPDRLRFIKIIDFFQSPKELIDDHEEKIAPRKFQKVAFLAWRHMQLHMQMPAHAQINLGE